jgi:phosphate transport system substrate-binding protein
MAFCRAKQIGALPAGCALFCYALGIIKIPSQKMTVSFKSFTKRLAAILPVLFFLAMLPCIANAQIVRISGAVSAVPPIRDARGILSREQNIQIEVNAEEIGSSSDGIRALGSGDAEVALSTHYLSGEDRAPWPSVNFMEFYIGEQAVVLAVSRDVWDGGIHALTRKQAQGIYDGRIRNWKEIGGPDLKITGYTAAPGYGVWETYVVWLYREGEWIRANRFALMSSNEEAKACIETTPGSIAQLALPWADGKTAFPLAIKDDKDNTVQPTIEAVASHAYPISRPLLIIINGKPVGPIKGLVDLMLSPRGQELVRKYSYLTLQDLGVK